MSTPTHILSGVVLTRFAELNGWIPSGGSPDGYVIAGIASVIPDIDIFAYGITSEHNIRSLLHKPFFWVILSCIVLWLVRSGAIVIPWSYVAVWITALCVHFVLDTANYSHGIQWCWPFLKTEYHLFPLTVRPAMWKGRFKIYLRSRSLKLEILLLASMGLYLIFLQRYIVGLPVSGIIF